MKNDMLTEIEGAIIMARRPVIDPWLEEDGKVLIEGWARDGLSNKEIAHNMGVSLNVFNKWKKENEIFAGFLKKSKEVADKVVENSLFRRANGFEYTETTEERVFNPLKNKFEMVITKKVNKVVLPDTTAQIFWLKNRKPDTWRDRREIDSTEAIDKLDGILTGIKAAAKQQTEIGPDSRENKPNE